MPSSKGYKLPDNHLPTETECVTLRIPKDPQYRAVLRGHLSLLGRWFSWETSNEPGDRRAAEAAQLWKETLYYSLGIDEMCPLEDVRQNTEQPCILEKKVIGGEWEEFARLRKCLPSLKVEGGKIYAQDDEGVWHEIQDDGSLGDTQPGEQPGGDTPIPNGECKSVSVFLPANSSFIVPFRVLPGDTIEMSTPEGAWYYDAATQLWRCGNGSAFALGSCGSEPVIDPVGLDGTHKVGRVIARYGASFLNPVDGVETIPTGDEYPLTFQMNDTDLSNNGGSMKFSVTVCSGEWCYNFAPGGYTGWTIQEGVISGTELHQSGYFVDVDAYYRLIYGYINLSGVKLTRIEIPYTSSLDLNALCCPENYIWFGSDSIPNRVYRTTVPPPADGLLLWTDANGQQPAQVGFNVYAGLKLGSPPGGTATVPSIKFFGRGSHPFGASNC